MNVIENLKPNQAKRQGKILAPPWTRKTSDNTFLSCIDQGTDDYGSAKLVRNNPRKTSDTYFTIKTRATSVRSYRRNYSHKSVALFGTKREGSTRKNIAFMTCSFLEIDGSTDNTIKTQGDVFTLVKKNNLPTPSYIIQTSPGHFHLLWTYVRPLPWSNKGESYWVSQQTRLIKLFQKSGFNVDKGASLNPCQNLRNPSQLKPFNFKRRCEVFIYKSFKKTSLRTLYKALNATNIPNPTPMKASTKLRRDWRENKTFITTQKEYAKKHGVSERTIRRELQKAIQNGDLQIVRRMGNNKGILRKTEYISNLYIEPQFSERTSSINKNNALKGTAMLGDFQANGAEKGYRNRTIFMLGLYLKCLLGKTASIGAIRSELLEGAMRCHVPRKEFERTLKNIMKASYTNPLGLPKLRDWGLLERREITEISLH